MFVDEVIVRFAAGRGGNGAIAWRREKYIPKGGPYGGDGGVGGNVFLRVSSNCHTLSDFRHVKEIKAEDGEKGGIKVLHGRNGHDKIVDVPPGTVVSNAETGEVLVDLWEIGQMFRICRGGRGGFGNTHFVSSTRQAPNFAELGDVGEEHTVKLELKLVADIAIVGLPNAGKSTLISVLTSVRPKIADYPFTTLTPHLGVMDGGEGRSLVLEDVPGLIPGASTGKGLGIEFLRHIERARAILHLVDASSEDPLQTWKSIRHEMEAFGSELIKKVEIVAISKMDIIAPDDRAEFMKRIKKELGKNVIFFSAASNEGVRELKELLLKIAAEEATKAPRDTKPEKAPTEGFMDDEVHHYDLTQAKRTERAWAKLTQPSRGQFILSGDRIEEIVRMTDTTNREAVARVYDVLTKQGALDRIRQELERTEWQPENEDDKPIVTIAGKVFVLERRYLEKERWRTMR